jgi:hypothetical protein
VLSPDITDGTKWNDLWNGMGFENIGFVTIALETTMDLFAQLLSLPSMLRVCSKYPVRRNCSTHAISALPHYQGSSTTGRIHAFRWTFLRYSAPDEECLNGENPL